MIVEGYGINSIREEIAKCEVRCANCHGIKTARDFKYWITKYAPLA